MGTAPPSKPVAEPSRPFQRQQKRACLQNSFVPSTRKGPSVLLQLVARREWQKVLIRVTLFPSEVTQRQKMNWYGVQWSLLPLHLACALQPPSEVIAMLLSFHSDTAREYMHRHSSPRTRKRLWRREKTRRKSSAIGGHNNYALYRSDQGLPKNGTAPSTSNGEYECVGESPRTSNVHDTSSLLEDEDDFHVFEANDDASDDSESIEIAERSAIAVRPDMLPNDKESSWPGEETHDDTESSTNSLNDFLGKRGLALQLSSTGSLEPIEVPSLGSEPQQSKMCWDLYPLLVEANSLLPLHVACLYRASPAVIRPLLEAYQNAAQTTALGMLPIHMVCAGFELPAPVLAPQSGPVPFPTEDEYDMVESLKLLEMAYPESLDYPSESNGMTPKMYIEETMDDGSYKNACMNALMVPIEDTSAEELAYEDMDNLSELEEISEHDDSNTGSDNRVPEEVRCDEDNSTIPSLQTETCSRYLGEDLPQIHGFSGSHLYSQLVSKDWEGALVTIEERPEEGSKWQYGMELDLIESMGSAIMWKRLPIHSACALHAPIGLVEVLISAYPPGIRAIDPFTGALPLHLACRHSAPPEMIKTIVHVYPKGSHISDDLGRLPLHVACLSGGSRLTFIYLLKAYPHAVLLKDDLHRTPLQYAKLNPTLKQQTIELLELVHQFLEKRPFVEDDYEFQGFASPRSVVNDGDDMSAAAGFYAERPAGSSHKASSSYEDQNNALSTGSRLLHEESFHVDSLAEGVLATAENARNQQGLETAAHARQLPVDSMPVDECEGSAIGNKDAASVSGDSRRAQETKARLDDVAGDDLTNADIVDAKMLPQENSPSFSRTNNEAGTGESAGQNTKLSQYVVSRAKHEDENNFASSVGCCDGNEHSSTEAVQDGVESVDDIDPADEAAGSSVDSSPSRQTLDRHFTEDPVVSVPSDKGLQTKGTFETSEEEEAEDLDELEISQPVSEESTELILEFKSELSHDTKREPMHLDPSTASGVINKEDFDDHATQERDDQLSTMEDSPQMEASLDTLPKRDG